jgi:hypothetical protein
MTWKFTSISFWKEQSVGAKEANKRRPEGPDEWAHAAHVPGRVGPPFWHSELRCRRSFLHRLRFDLKTPIKIVPRRSLEGAPQKHRNTETETWSCRLEGENSGGALPAWSPSSPTTSPPSPWWRGSSPPLDYGFVEVTYVSLSLELH